MPPLPARPLWTAVLSTAVLGGLLIAYALDSTLTPYTVLSGSAGVATGLAAIVMSLWNPFPARLAAVVLCLLGALAAVLAMVVGLPGESATGLTLRGTALLACGLLVPVLVAVQATSGTSQHPRPAPYAR